MAEDMDHSKQELQKSIRNRFASLGIQFGADGISPHKKQQDFLIEKVVEGDFDENQFGTYFYTETHYPIGKQYGNQLLHVTQMPDAILRMMNPAYEAHADQDFIYIDTETSGLSGGVGTWAFMVGVVRQVEDQFVAKQFFMRSPAEERAMLYGLEQFVGDAKVVVSFNGKSFDIPMLRTRFQMQRMPSALFEMAHYDLLHLSRKLWRYNLDDRRLGNLEVQKLGVHRTHQDVPGFIIPSLYRDYLKNGDARPLKSIFYHNLVDIVSLVTLANVLNENFDSQTDIARQAEEWMGIAQHFESVEMFLEAISAYQKALANGLSFELACKAQHAIAKIYKREREWDNAVELWQPLAQAGDLEACVELAKVYEHRVQEMNNNAALMQAGEGISLEEKKNFLQQAQSWTVLAIQHANQSRILSQFWMDDLQHRKNRINDKIQRLENKIGNENDKNK
jgi:uncharacterized protein YprB with RNaseH-like and TPR domain